MEIISERTVEANWMTKQTWNIEDMAEYLDKSPATIKTYMSRKRHILPPCIKGIRARWVKEVAINFFKEQSLEGTRCLQRRPRRTTI